MIRPFLFSLKQFHQREDGPTAVEYAVMLSLIIIVCITAVTALGRDSRREFRRVSRTLQRATDGR
jgi:pilus assembly protein Flp/PilA